MQPIQINRIHRGIRHPTPDTLFCQFPQTDTPNFRVLPSETFFLRFGHQSNREEGRNRQEKTQTLEQIITCCKHEGEEEIESGNSSPRIPLQLNCEFSARRFELKKGAESFSFGLTGDHRSFFTRASAFAHSVYGIAKPFSSTAPLLSSLFSAALKFI